MKTMVFEFKTPGPGDLVIINACAPRGGKISCKRKILGGGKKPITDGDGFITGYEEIPPDDCRAIAHDLAGQISKEWMPECVKAKVQPKDGSLIINCTDLFSDVNFSSEVHGEGGTVIEMTEF